MIGGSSKDDGPYISAASFEGRLRGHLGMTAITARSSFHIAAAPALIGPA
jgi:hypothetical protein